MSKKKKIILLGASGSIGLSTIKLIRSKKDYFDLIGISVHSNVKFLTEIVKEFNVKYVAISNLESSKDFKSKATILYGRQGLIDLSSINCDLVVSGISGVSGLLPALNAIRSGSNLAIANKEPLVVAGKFFVSEAKKHNVKILPVDSEHNSIFQCFNESQRSNISHITLTASGGPFLNLGRKDLTNIKPIDAIKHPTWRMGKKISVDSATMVNKALEIIEAGVLFNLTSKEIDVLIHPQSIIHGLVHYKDGSTLANLSNPDMISPLAVALAYPQRLNLNLKTLSLGQISNLTFFEPDLKKFPALKFGWQALKLGGAYPVIFNAANEVAVEYFLNNLISFNNIIDLIENSLSVINFHSPKNVDDALEIDRITRLKVIDYIKGL